MQNVKRVFALVLAFAMILTIFPGAAFVAAEQMEEVTEDPANAEPTTDSEASDESTTQTVPSNEPAGEADTTEVSPDTDPSAAASEEAAEETESVSETVAPTEAETTPPDEGNETAEEVPENETEADTGPRTSLTAKLEEGSATLTINAPNGTVFSDEAAFHAHTVEPEYEQLEDICLSYEVPNILDCFAFEMSTEGVSLSSDTSTVEITFEDPFLLAVNSNTIRVFQYVEGTPVPIPVYASVSESHLTYKMVIEPENRSFNSRYVVITSDVPNLLLEVGTQVAYMAVNTLNNKRVGLSGNGISFTTSGIMWHYISDQRKPAICLQPNKTFQTSNAAAYYTENTTLGGSSTSSVGGNVWNSLSRDQRRLIGMIILYGVQTHWDSSVGNNGLNTAYNLQYPTNPNQCLFAAQQIMAWEVITGNRSATYPYTCYDSTLINAFGGNVPTMYTWLENQLRAHDSATSTIPSPENSTYRLAWLSSGFQTVIQVVDVQYETPAPPTASLTVRKASSTATGSNASQQFTFKVFRNSALTSQVGSTQYLAPGRNFSLTLDPGVTYYVAEVAMDGWNCTTSGVSTKTVNGVTYYYQSITPAAGGSYSVTLTNEPIVKKNVTLQKSINAPTACVNLIKNNAMYSLAGAEYSVTLNGVLQETLVTDANGNATSSKTYNVGDQLTIKETQAPKGFKLDTTSHKHTVVNGTNTIAVSDVPLFDPPFVLTKVDSNTTTPQGNGSFSGAVFKWEYYDNTSWSGNAKATWYFASNSSGRVQYDPSYLAAGYTSSDLYSPAANSYQIPLGSVKITEVKSPLGYAVIQNPLYCTITQDASSSIGVALTWTAESLQTLINVSSGNYNIPEPIDTSLFGSVTVQKTDFQTGTAQGAATLAGAEFQVINSSTNSVKIGNQVVAPGKVCMTLTTDANGVATSGAGVLPLGKYTIKETKAPAGYTLNTQWVKEFTITAENKDFTFNEGNACPDNVIRGGLKIIKQDANLLANTDESSPLSGITFSVISENEVPVMVNDKTYKKGETVMILEIKWDGRSWYAATADNALPYGTYTVKENPMQGNDGMANEDYILNAIPQTVTIKDSATIIPLTFLNEARNAGMIHIEKMTSSNTRLEGVGFLLQWSEDGQQWQRITYSDKPGQKGGCTTEGLVNGVLKTDKNGIVEFTGLHSKLLYRITEIETVNGYSLLPDAAYEGPLPADNLELALRVVDDTTFMLPHTGSTAMRMVSAAAALCTLCGICLLMSRRKRK